MSDKGIKAKKTEEVHTLFVRNLRGFEPFADFYTKNNSRMALQFSIQPRTPSWDLFVGDQRGPEGVSEADAIRFVATGELP